MKLKEFSLSIGHKSLIKNVTIDFGPSTIHHILGKNGAGKTCLAKAIIGAMKYHGTIERETTKTCVIGSYTNLPSELKIKDIFDIIESHFSCRAFDTLKKDLNIDALPLKTKIKNLSDGQKQKMKLLFFLSSEPELIVLDEFTNALDKKTCLDIYQFLMSYIDNQARTIINITHNLTDIEYLKGRYYLLNEEKIHAGLSKDEVIDFYIKG